MVCFKRAWRKSIHVCYIKAVHMHIDDSCHFLWSNEEKHNLVVLYSNHHKTHGFFIKFIGRVYKRVQSPRSESRNVWEWNYICKQMDVLKQNGFVWFWKKRMKDSLSKMNGWRFLGFRSFEEYNIPLYSQWSKVYLLKNWQPDKFVRRPFTGHLFDH